VFVPALVWVAPRPLAAGVVLAIAAAAVGTELSRNRIRLVRYWFLRRTRSMLRYRERRGLAGATWMALAYAGAVIVFPTPVAVAAMLYTALGDAIASLVGRRWGRRRFANGKSAEGTLAALIANVVIGLMIPGIGALAAIAGAVAASGLEAADLPPDDNLWVVMGGGGVLWLALLAGG